MSHLKTLDPDRMQSLCTYAMVKFCEGYGMMFDKEFSCSLASCDTIQADAILSKAGDINALSRIACKGSYDGELFIVFNKTALFILGGATIMLPPMRINESCQRGSLEDAQALADAVGEIGNLLVGELSIAFRVGNKEQSGMGDTERLHLQLPISIGQSTVEAEADVSSYNLMSFSMDLKGFDPFELYLAYPAS